MHDVPSGHISFLLGRAALLRLGPQWRGRALAGGLVVWTATLLSQVELWRYGFHCCEVWNAARNQARGLLMLVNHDAIQPWSLNTLDNAPNYIKPAANALQKIGLLKTRLRATASLKEFKQAKSPLPVAKAAVLSTAMEAGLWVVRGHARFSAARPADVILFTAEGEDAILAMGVPRPQPVLRLAKVDYEFTNLQESPITDEYEWEARLKLEQIPAGESA